MIPEWRAWPAPGEPCWSEGRPHVVDRIELVLTREYDYQPVRDRLLATDFPGVVILDWDIAMAQDDLRRMTRRAKTDPTEGFVAPYWLYDRQACAHRRGDGLPVTDDPYCALPGFGAIYLPRHLAEGWRPIPADPRMTDQNFGLWAHGQGVKWAIDWRLRPIHLHSV